MLKFRQHQMRLQNNTLIYRASTRGFHTNSHHFL